MCLSHCGRFRPRRLDAEESNAERWPASSGEPTILLADVLTTALDAENGRAIMHIPTGLARDRGLTVVIVSHAYRILRFADRILDLHDGKLTDEGDAVATAQRPADLAGPDRRSERSFVL